MKLFKLILTIIFGLQLSSIDCGWHVGEGMEEGEFYEEEFRIEVQSAIENNTINEKPYLAEACFYGFNSVAKLLIDNGADLDKPYILSTFKSRPLERAINNNNEKINLELIELLLNAGSKIKKKDFLLACENDKLKLINLLLKKGAVKYINEADNFGHNSLFFALIRFRKIFCSNKEQYEIVKLLLSYGANIYKRYKNIFVHLLMHMGNQEKMKQNNNILELIPEIKSEISDEYKDSFEKLKDFLFNFRDKSIELENYFKYQSSQKPTLDKELLEVIFMRLINLRKFEDLFKFINAYKEEINALSYKFNLIAEFIVKFYQNKVSEESIKSTLLGNFDNSLESEVYNIAKNNGFIKLGQFIRTACLLSKFKIPEDIKKLINSF